MGGRDSAPLALIPEALDALLDGERMGTAEDAPLPRAGLARARGEQPPPQDRAVGARLDQRQIGVRAHRAAEDDALVLGTVGGVVKSGEIRMQRLRRGDGIGSGGEVNHALAGRLAEALPAIDLAHGDLAGGEPRPEQPCCGLGRGQHGLRLDAPLELLVQPLDRPQVSSVAALIQINVVSAMIFQAEKQMR